MRKLGWIIAGIFGLLLLLPEPEDRASNPPETPRPETAAPQQKAGKTPPPPPKPANTTSPDILPLDPDKTRAIATLPRSASLTPPDAPVTAPPLPTVYVTGSRVNLRDGPGTGHRILWQAPRGTAFFLQAERNGWSRLTGQTPNGPVSGWMSSRYLAAKRPLSQAASRTTKRQVASPAPRDIAAARKAIIQQSINAYSGSCPCPYFRDRAGRRCGKRSAWNRRGGYAPLCYDSDVSEARLRAHFARRRN